jgi:iron(III) transport system substrate-binding protein
MVPTDDIVLVKLYDEGWVSANKDAITTKFNEHLEKSLN